MYCFTISFLAASLKYVPAWTVGTVSAGVARAVAESGGVWTACSGRGSVLQTLPVL